MIKYEDIQKENMLLPEDEKEPYIGFQLGYFHSKNMGIKRVNTNNRYQQSLVPNFELKTNQDTKIGTRLYKQEVKDKQIKIDFVFDSLTQNEFDQVKNWLGNSELQPLILDEEENYSYIKLQGQPNINYICFDEEKNGIVQRVYKGEGSVNFIQYKMDKNKGSKQWSQLVNKYVDLNNSYYRLSHSLQDLKGKNENYSLTYKKEITNETKEEILKQINLLYDIPLSNDSLDNSKSLLNKIKNEFSDYIFYPTTLESIDFDNTILNFSYPEKLPCNQSYYNENLYPEYYNNWDKFTDDIQDCEKELDILPNISIILFNNTLLLSTRSVNDFFRVYEYINNTVIYRTAPQYILNQIKINRQGFICTIKNTNTFNNEELSDFPWKTYRPTIINNAPYFLTYSASIDYGLRLNNSGYVPIYRSILENITPYYEQDGIKYLLLNGGVK